MRRRTVPRRNLEHELAKIEANSIPVPFSGCQIWLGALSPDGYPECTVFGKMTWLHRFVCEQTHGAFLPGQFAIHSCDIRCCIAPEHIRPGTHKDNMQDMKDRRRWRNKTHRG